MSLEGSSKQQDYTPPNFIDQGDAITCAIGDSTLLARDWHKDKGGVKTTLTFQNGTGPIATDRVTLNSQKSRSRFITSLPERHRPGIEPVFFSLEEYLRTKMAKVDVNKKGAAAVTLTDDERKKAEDLLGDTDLLDKFLKATEQLNFVGEKDNKIALYLAYSSRKLQQPIGITVKGESSAGKNFLVNGVVQFFPSEDVESISSATPKAFFYLPDDLSHKVVIVAEAPGAADADYSIRTLESEGEISILVPEKDPVTGSITTAKRRVKGPVAFIQTTTRAHLYNENETRHFDLYIDESENQTRRIFEAQAKKYLNQGEPEKEALLKVWQNAQRLLESLPVLIPYVETIKFPTKPLRVRRDRPRFLALIEASTLLHQKHRQYKEINGQRFIVANYDDYEIAHELGAKILDRVLKGATPKCEELVKAVEEIASDTDFTRAMVEKKLGWDRKTVTKYLKEAVGLGCLDELPQGKGKPSLYQFIKLVAEIDCGLLSREKLEEECAKNGINFKTPVHMGKTWGNPGMDNSTC